MPPTPIHRRSLLKGAVTGLAGLFLPRFAAAATGRAAVTRLTDRLAMIGGVGGNVVALTAEDGVLLVDSGGPNQSDAMLGALRDLPGQGRVRTLINTHWHWDQTGGNELIGRSGAKLIAHERSRLWLATDHWLPAEQRYEKARPREAVPTEAIYTTAEMSFRGEQIEYGYLLEAHTAGDLYVLFKNANVLVVGDAVAPESDPVLDWFAGGWLGGRIDAQALLLTKCNDTTKVIASTGGVIGRAQIQAEHDALAPIFNRIAELMRKGYTTQAMLEAGVLKESGRRWNDPGKFMHDAHKGLWAHHNTLAHEIV